MKSSFPLMAAIALFLLSLCFLKPTTARADQPPPPPPPSSPPAVFVLRAGKLIDPETGTAAENQVIVVEGAKIKAVGAADKIVVPAGAQVIDLSGDTVLPGLFDCHTHLCLTLTPKRDHGDADYNGYIYTTAYRALQGSVNARTMLEAGFTTVRDVGNSANFADTDLRKAVENGLIPGPTIVNSGPIIAPYGGQVQLQPEKRELGEPEYRYADTRDELLKAIRENIHFGAKVIKIVVDGQPYIYSPEDIRFIVEEAGRAGRKVCAHCQTQVGAHNAVLGGVASVEHGWRLADDDLKLMKRKGIVLVNGSGPALIQAQAIGVTLAFGTDCFGEVSAENTRGMQAIRFIDRFVQANIPPADILRSLTVNAARLLGADSQRGAIRAGLHADIVAVKGNPLANIDALKSVVFVMKDGVVYRSH